MLKLKKVLYISLAIALVFGLAGTGYLVYIYNNLPEIVTVEDYQPLVVARVYDRNNEEIGQFKREGIRVLVPFEKMPKHLIQAFVAAEDSSFFEHGGINYTAIFRALIANIKAGRKVQGGSTITQQVAKSLLLSSEKTYIRKLKEAFLAYQMEDNLSKEEILYLYLNQIYFGHGAYGVEAASQAYFRKSVDQIDVKEAAILAGLPQAPSRYAPIYHPKRAKDRQLYVLNRMAEEGFISEEQAKTYGAEDLKVYQKENFKEIAPYFLEMLRTYLVEKLGESYVLDKGIKVFTSLDKKAQLAANTYVEIGLRELDKRQGFRGAIKNIQDQEEIKKFLKQVRDDAISTAAPFVIIHPDGSVKDAGELKLDKEKEKDTRNLPDYINEGDIVKAIVDRVDDRWGIVHVRFAENKGLIDFETMKWAHAPDPEKYEWEKQIRKPSEALSKGDVIEVRIIADVFRSSNVNEKLRILKSREGKNYKRPQELPEFDNYVDVQLEQEPLAEAALLSIDMQTHEVVAMTGGYDFERSEFNRSIQAGRQTGSVFKPLVYLSALDKGYTPASIIVDSPLVYEELVKDDSGGKTIKKWKPHNYTEKFRGDVLFRNALIKSLNIPTIKIQEDVTVPWVADYAKRLGVFSPLNMDLTLGLGSSSVTLYEMTKLFAQIGNLGRKISPKIIHRVTLGEEVLLENISLDDRFQNELAPIEQEFEERRKAYFEKLQAKLNADENQDQAETDEEQEQEKKELNTVPKYENPILYKAKKRKDPPFFFKDPKQLIDPRTAYLMTSLLAGVVQEGTGAKARALGRPTAGKTGTTNGFYDAWFVGFTANFASGVWVGFDTEKSLGRGEAGGKAALPIWVDYMKDVHKGLPPKAFPLPRDIVFANIDNKNGKLATASSESVVRQGFLEGTAPDAVSGQEDFQDSREFFKEDLAF